MKKKFRKEFHREFPWYDHTFLLKLIVLWLDHSSKAHRDKGHLLGSKRTGHQMKVVSGVLKRIIEDEYDKPCRVFTSRNKFTSSEFEYLDLKYQNKHRQADIDFVFDMMKKHLLSWWD